MVEIRDIQYFADGRSVVDTMGARYTTRVTTMGTRHTTRVNTMSARYTTRVNTMSARYTNNYQGEHNGCQVLIFFLLLSQRDTF